MKFLYENIGLDEIDRVLSELSDELFEMEQSAKHRAARAKVKGNLTLWREQNAVARTAAKAHSGLLKLAAPF